MSVGRGLGKDTEGMFWGTAFLDRIYSILTKSGLIQLALSSLVISYEISHRYVNVTFLVNLSLAITNGIVKVPVMPRFCFLVIGYII